eukprot:c4107_g1_i1 orf=27-296(+)
MARKYQIFLKHLNGDFVSGWMHLTQQGKVGGPYKLEQVFEAFQTGFRPEELSVYRVSEGKFDEPAPLKIVLSQFLEPQIPQTPSEISKQ